MDQHSEKAARVKRLARLSRLMDTEFRVPGTKWRFGLDPLIGLIPGAGDAVSAGFSLWIVLEAYRLGMSATTIARMLVNVVLDLATGAIPILGDLFDAGYKANSRNIRLLERHLNGQSR